MKKILCLILIFGCFTEKVFAVDGCTGSAGTEDCTDSFDRTNASTLGANWTSNISGNHYGITSNQAVPNSTGDGMDHWNTVTFANNQFSEATLIAFTGTNNQSGVGVCVRMSPTLNTDTGYCVVANTAVTNNTTLYKRVAGAFTQIAQATVTWAVNDIIRLEVTGDNLTGYQNGVSKITGTGGSSISSGSPGIAYSSTTTSKTLDAWHGGDLGGGGGGSANSRPCSVIICGEDFP